MPDQQTTEESSEKKPPKKGKKKLLIILLVLIMLLGGGGFAAWKMSLGPFAKLNELKKKVTESGKEKKKKKKKKDSMGPVFAFETFIVNLASSEGERYLKITVNAELEDKKVEQEITQRVPQLRDAIIILLSSKTFDDIIHTDGKENLKREILARVNSFLSSGEAKRIYFTELVVQ